MKDHQLGLLHVFVDILVTVVLLSLALFGRNRPHVLPDVLTSKETEHKADLLPNYRNALSDTI